MLRRVRNGRVRGVPTDDAESIAMNCVFMREAIRLALKYNRGVTILLPAHLFPPHFITIASSNFDDAVEFRIDEEALRRLQDPSLATDQFHELYNQLTTPKKAGG